MSGGLTLSSPLVRALSLVWLVVVWMALWGDASLGTALGGAGAGVVVLVVCSRGATAQPVAIRPLAVLRLAGAFSVMLVQSTVEVVRSTLHFTDELHSVVLTVHLPPCPPAVATLVANAVTLTPGTLSLELEVRADESASLHVHALDAPDAEEVRRDVLRLHALATAAFGRPPGATPPPPSTAATRSGASPVGDRYAARGGGRRPTPPPSTPPGSAA